MSTLIFVKYKLTIESTLKNFFNSFTFKIIFFRKKCYICRVEFVRWKLFEVLNYFINIILLFSERNITPKTLDFVERERERERERESNTPPIFLHKPQIIYPLYTSINILWCNYNSILYLKYKTNVWYLYKYHTLVLYFKYNIEL